MQRAGTRLIAMSSAGPRTSKQITNPLRTSVISSSSGTHAMAKKLDLHTKYRLNSGYEIPILGFGVYQTPASVTEDVVTHALNVGYQHVDSATVYRNEAPSASALKKSGIPREELFFTSKVPPRSMSHALAAAAVDETLRKTGLDYVDLYLLHAPYGGKDGRLGAWKALVEAVEAGKVRSIGVSNYGVHHLEELERWMEETEAREGQGKGGVLSVNQVELHPWLARPDIVQWCEKRGVILEVLGQIWDKRHELMNGRHTRPSCEDSA